MFGDCSGKYVEIFWSKLDIVELTTLMIVSIVEFSGRFVDFLIIDWNNE
jgi:hypothetical protein